MQNKAGDRLRPILRRLKIDNMQPEKQRGTNGRAKSQNGANLGFEAELFLAADKLRKNLEPSDYKHVALGLIFLKHISNAFEAKRAALLAEDAAAAEDPDEYLAENVFWVPKEARWSHLQANAKQPTIGKLIDDAMTEIERGQRRPQGRAAQGLQPPGARQGDAGRVDRPDLRHRAWASRATRPRTCSAASTNISSAASPARKASAAASSIRRARWCACWSRCWSPTRAASTTRAAARAACSCSPRSSSKATAAGSATSPSTGRRCNYTTWRLCKMNLAVRGIDADIRWNNEGSFHKDELQGPALRLHPRQSAVQHFRLGRRAAARGCALDLWRAAGRQRQLRLASAHSLAPRAERHGGRGAGQRLDVVRPERRGHDPPAPWSRPTWWIA